MIPGRIGIRTTHKHHLTYKCSWFCSCIGFSCHLTALQFLFAPELWQALISLHNRRFASQVRRTRNFARSSRRAPFFILPSSRAFRSFRAKCRVRFSWLTKRPRLCRLILLHFNSCLLLNCGRHSFQALLCYRFSQFEIDETHFF